MKTNFFSLLLRNKLILVIGIAGIIIFAISVGDAVKNLTGSHRDFAEMEIADFRDGDVLCGTIPETLGSAITVTTTEYTMGIKTDSYESADYYVIPYFSSIDDLVPNKIILYRTGNSAERASLNALTDQTWDYYYGLTEKTDPISVKRAYVSKMSDEDYSYLRDFIEEYVNVYYEDYLDEPERKRVYNSYMAAVVPYTMSFRADDGVLGIIFGLAMIAIAAVILVFAHRIENKRNAANAYIPPQPADNTYPGNIPVQQPTEGTFRDSTAVPPAAETFPESTPTDNINTDNNGQ